MVKLAQFGAFIDCTVQLRASIFLNFGACIFQYLFAIFRYLEIYRGEEAKRYAAVALILTLMFTASIPINIVLATTYLSPAGVCLSIRPPISYYYPMIVDVILVSFMTALFTIPLFQISNFNPDARLKRIGITVLAANSVAMASTLLFNFSFAIPALAPYGPLLSNGSSKPCSSAGNVSGGSLYRSKKLASTLNSGSVAKSEKALSHIQQLSASNNLLISSGMLYQPFEGYDFENKRAKNTTSYLFAIFRYLEIYRGEQANRFAAMALILKFIFTATIPINIVLDSFARLPSVYFGVVDFQILIFVKLFQLSALIDCTVQLPATVTMHFRACTFQYLFAICRYLEIYPADHAIRFATVAGILTFTFNASIPINLIYNVPYLTPAGVCLNIRPPISYYYPMITDVNLVTYMTTLFTIPLLKAAYFADDIQLKKIAITILVANSIAMGSTLIFNFSFAVPALAPYGPTTNSAGARKISIVSGSSYPVSAKKGSISRSIPLSFDDDALDVGASHQTLHVLKADVDLTM
ncbi:hypothetical protein HDU76_006239 [Blyttiomyces sp. JEL0837]|nr:hypothetical protein HDU76_006239 [Blyttiomyces sp. JEL0837]